METVYAKQELERDELICALQTAQNLRPLLLRQLGYVPECVLTYCNEARALLKRLQP